MTYCKNSVEHLQKQILHIPEKMIFFKLCFKGCSKWICEYVTTRNYKNIFRRYFMRGFQKKTQKHKWQQAYFRVHFVFSWFWSLVWCRMLALLSWTPIPTVSINVCSPHPPPCMMLPFWLTGCAMGKEGRRVAQKVLNWFLHMWGIQWCREDGCLTSSNWLWGCPRSHPTICAAVL